MSLLDAINPFYRLKVRRMVQEQRRMTREVLLFAYLEHVTTLLEKNLYLQSVRAGYSERSDYFKADKYVRKGRHLIERAISNYKAANEITRNDPFAP